jgi:hypothetical protein
VQQFRTDPAQSSGLRSKKSPAEGEVFFLDFYLYRTSQELAQLSKSSTGKVNANTGHLTCEADATPNTGLSELAVYTDSLVSDGGQSVEANCFRARNNRERIAPGATCSIAPASSVVYS